KERISSMKKSVTLLGVCLAALLFGGVLQSRAQSTTATLSGVVIDESGAVLPSTQLTVTNTATGVKRTLESDERGRFIVAQLPLVQAGVNDVLTGDTAQSKGSGARISMGGSRVDQTAWLLDGTNIGSPSFFGTPGGAAGVMLGVDAVREFQVLTSNYSAEVG